MPINIPSAQNLHTQDVITDTSATNFGTVNTSGNGNNSGTKPSGNLPINTHATQLGLNDNNSGGIRWDNTSFNANTDHKIFISGFQFNAPNRMGVDSSANGGIVSRVYSGTSATNNFIEYSMGGNDTTAGKSQQGVNLYIIDPLALGGTETGIMDETAVTGWGFGAQATTSGSSGVNARVWTFFCRTFLLSSEKNNSDIPTFTGVSDFDDLVDEIQGTGNYTTKIHELAKSGTVYTIACPFQIGDNGTTTTTFNDNGITVQSPSNNDTANPLIHISNKAMRVYASIGASDSITLSGVYIWGTQAPWDLSSTLGTINLNGANFTGMGNFTLGSSVSGPATYNLGGTSKVISNGANIDGSTIENDLDIQGSSITTFTNLTVNGVMDFNTSGNYNLNSCTINEVTNSSGGAVTLTIDTDTTITTNTGPNITVEIPVQYTISNIVAGSRIQIYNTTTSTEIYNAIVAGTSYSDTYTEGTDFTDGDIVRVRLTCQSGTTACEWFTQNALASSSGWSVVANQMTLTAYPSLGVDGSTVTEYSLDGTNVQVDANDTDGLTTKKRLVAWYYYAGTTEVGIRDFFDGVELEDEANAKIVTSIVDLTVDNVSSRQLRMTDTDFRLYRDDGNTWIEYPSTGGYGIDTDSGKVFITNAGDIWAVDVVNGSFAGGSAASIIKNIPRVIARKSDL
jgi:hypothetical protein